MFFFKSDWLSMVQFSKVQFRKSNLVSKKLIKLFIITGLALFDLLFIMKLYLTMSKIPSSWTIYR